MTPAETILCIEELEFTREEVNATTAWQIAYLSRVEEMPRIEDWIPRRPQPPVDDDKLQDSIEFAKSIGLKGPWTQEVK